MTSPYEPYVSDRERARRHEIDAAARVIAARLSVDDDQAHAIAERLPPPPDRKRAGRVVESWRVWRARVTPAHELLALEQRGDP